VSSDIYDLDSEGGEALFLHPSRLRFGDQLIYDCEGKYMKCTITKI
jgi:hypothetical protein